MNTYHVTPIVEIGPLKVSANNAIEAAQAARIIMSDGSHCWEGYESITRFEVELDQDPDPRDPRLPNQVTVDLPPL